VPPITLDRSEALDIFAVLLDAERELEPTGTVQVLFDLDGAIRILFRKLFTDLDPGEG
jgi:hypothetical protein